MKAQDKATESLRHPPLRESTALLQTDGRVLDQLHKDFYVYLQNALPLDAVKKLKQEFLDVLIEMGFVDPGSVEPVWNGTDLTDFPVKVEQLHERRVWIPFVEDKGVNDVFRRILGAEPFWLPIVEYRVTPPAAALPEDPYIGRHQDGFYNGDLDCYTCWVPLMEIGAEEGGLAMASTLRPESYLHDANDPPQYMIPSGTIPEDAWHRSHYHEGDLVMFNRWIPHSGLPNLSNRFRLSMDVRVMPVDGELPIWGKVLEFTPSMIRVENHDGREVSLTIDAETYCRWTAGKRIPTEELISLIPPGDSVLAFHEGSRALMLRPPR